MQSHAFITELGTTHFLVKPHFDPGYNNVLMFIIEEKTPYFMLIQSKYEKSHYVATTDTVSATHTVNTASRSRAV